MQLELHQLDRRWEHLRVREPQRQSRLLASLADGGQQTPIVVVAAGPPDRYLVIDGHKRVAALEQLGRDTVEATLWAMSEAEALLLSRSLRFSPQESALEQGWLLAPPAAFSKTAPARRECVPGPRACLCARPYTVVRLAVYCSDAQRKRPPCACSRRR